MSGVQSATTSEAYAQFGKWLIEQPYWLQDAAWRIYSGKEIDDAQIKLYAEMCVAQAKGETPSYNHLNSNEIFQQKGSRKVSVLSISDVCGVNALADNVGLDFAENGVTVVYGLNGAGKSGFMRIFKELSGCPYREPIQPNVFKKNGAKAPSCKVVVTQDGAQVEKTYDLSAKQENSVLAVCDVFDTRISNQYISSTNNVSYQPFVFTVLSELAKIADRIGGHISSLVSAIPSVPVTIPAELETSPSLQWLKKIDKDTVIPSELIAWDEGKETEYLEIPKLLNSESVKQQQKLVAASIRSISSVLEDIRAALRSYDKDKFVLCYQEMMDAKRRFDAAQALFSSDAHKQDQISINSSDWKTLWSMARKYYEEFIYPEKGVHFADDGSLCPICHQEIRGSVYQRVNSVDQYINGSCSNDYQASQKAFAQLYSSVTDRRITAAFAKNTLSDIINKDELNAVVTAYEVIEAAKAQQGDEARYKMLVELNLGYIEKILSEQLNALTNKARQLEAALQDDAKIKLKERLEQLRSHKWVFDNQAIIREAVSNICHREELAAAKSFLTTNKITMETNKLANALITQAYIDRFTEELSKMARNIKVKLEKAASQKGNSPYKVTMDACDSKKYKPEDILSEGEQRIVALAAFFADATGREDCTPIIIDDPISSLDLNYEESATKRIVEIANNRQVIVFTHRISLLVGMSEACAAENVPIKELHIRSTLSGKGLPDFEDVYHGKVKGQLGGLKDKLSRAKKMDADSAEYNDCIGRVCQQFRICVERSVEDVLLLGIVRRFHRNIRTNNMVTKLPAITEQDCKMVDDMMTKYSFVEHSQPSEIPPLQYTVEEIEKDIQAFITWITEYLKKQNA